MNRVGHVADIRWKKNACRVLVGKHEGKSQLERDRRRWRIILKYILNK
jgi:hypothetical protein